jgi:hypothetical protein
LKSPEVVDFISWVTNKPSPVGNTPSEHTIIGNFMEVTENVMVTGKNNIYEQIVDASGIDRAGSSLFCSTFPQPPVSPSSGNSLQRIPPDGFSIELPGPSGVLQIRRRHRLAQRRSPPLVPLRRHVRPRRNLLQGVPLLPGGHRTRYQSRRRSGRAALSLHLQVPRHGQKQPAEARRNAELCSTSEESTEAAFGPAQSRKRAERVLPVGRQRM